MSFSLTLKLLVSPLWILSLAPQLPCNHKPNRRFTDSPHKSLTSWFFSWKKLVWQILHPIVSWWPLMAVLHSSFDTRSGAFLSTELPLPMAKNGTCWCAVLDVDVKRIEITWMLKWSLFHPCAWKWGCYATAWCCLHMRSLKKWGQHSVEVPNQQSFQPSSQKEISQSAACGAKGGFFKKFQAKSGIGKMQEIPCIFFWRGGLYHLVRRWRPLMSIQ